MEKLRILAKNLDEKNKIINLFIELGYKGDSFYTCDNNELMGIHAYEDGPIQDVLDDCYNDSNHKEITIQQLKDLVVLKRNDVDDATHKDKEDDKYYISNESVYRFICNKWEKSNIVPFLYKIEKKEMKEYLDPNANYRLFKIKPEDAAHWMIEIPEGANFAAYNKMMNNFYFDKENVFSPEYLIWQRNNQTIASAVESVNDKVASAEMARQESKEWDLGDYAFAESDALIESNVEQSSVDSTLAERESQYGSFVGVANTTGQLMSILLNSKNGYSLPYAHQEALHMICSKMARIVNGDYNHLDSWHDIGGYSKLIENLISEHENEL